MHSKEIVDIVKAKRAEGISFSQISRDLCLSKSTIQSILSRKESRYKKKTGSKPIIRKKESLSIKRVVNKMMARGEKVNCSKILAETGLNSSAETVRRHMNKNKYNYKNVPRNIVLSKEHKAKRVLIVEKWIKENMNFSKIIFSDEKRFSCDGPDNWCTYISENFKFERNKRQNRGPGLMYWGMCLPSGKVFLKEIMGRQNSESYRSLLKDYAVPLINQFYGTSWTLQQDNCSIHVSKFMMEYYNEANISLLDWPSRSPDLNIMENIWKMLSDHVYDGLQPRNKVELRLKIYEAVEFLNDTRTENIVSLFEEYYKRLCTLIRLNGKIINK